MLKVISRENVVHVLRSQWKILVSYTSKECDNGTTPYYPINFFCSIFCQVVAYGRLKTKEIFKVKLLKWQQLFIRGSRVEKVSNIVIWLETLGILENWSLRRGDEMTMKLRLEAKFKKRYYKTNFERFLISHFLNLQTICLQIYI